MTKKIDELTAISRMIEHVGDHLSDLDINDAEINRLLSSLQFRLLAHVLKSSALHPNLSEASELEKIAS